MSAISTCCVICSCEFLSKSIKVEEDTKEETSKSNKLWEDFCEYFKVHGSEWTDVINYSSQLFCPECDEKLCQLFQFREMLAEIQSKVHKLTSEISTKILNKTPSPISTSTSLSLIPVTDESSSLEIIHDDRVIKRIQKLKRKLAKQFQPKVRLQNCLTTIDFNVNSTETKPEEEYYLGVLEPNVVIKEEEDDYGSYEFANPVISTFPSIDIDEPIPKKKKRIKSDTTEVRVSRWTETEDEIGQPILMYDGKWLVHPICDSVRWDASKIKFRCATCEQTRSSKNTIAEHIRTTHISPENYTCPICGMKFTRTNNLKGHLPVHSSERPFVCDVGSCKSSFKLKRVLVRHKQLVHNVKTVSEYTKGKSIKGKDKNDGKKLKESNSKPTPNLKKSNQSQSYNEKNKSNDDMSRNKGRSRSNNNHNNSGDEDIIQIYPDASQIQVETDCDEEEEEGDDLIAVNMLECQLETEDDL